MTNISSVAMCVANMDAMLKFYSQAFGVKFHEVDTYSIHSQFGEVGGVMLKFVPIRDEADFENYPVHQLGFIVPDVEAVIALALQHGGREEGKVIRNGAKTEGAVRDPDGNTIELYTE